MKSREQCFDEIVSQPFKNGEYTFSFIAPKEGVHTAEFNIMVDEYLDLENVLLLTSQYSIAEDNKIKIKAKVDKRCLKIIYDIPENELIQVGDYLFFDFDYFLHLLSFAQFQVAEC